MNRCVDMISSRIIKLHDVLHLNVILGNIANFLIIVLASVLTYPLLANFSYLLVLYIKHIIQTISVIRAG